MVMNDLGHGQLKPAVFLDRDGTINFEKNYLYKIEDFEFIPGAPEAIKGLKDAGFLVAVVTNQSGIARGYYTLDDVTRLHQYIQRELQGYNTSIDAFYTCPHHPGQRRSEYGVNCSCRKPAPGMFEKAAAELGIELSQSFMVGDKISDIEAGRAAGCRPVLVLTGYGAKTATHFDLVDVPVFDSITQVANYIIGV